MATTYEERETKFDVPADFVVPDLADVVDQVRVTHSTVQLESTYYDTADLALLAHHVTLRRRAGDTDVGWQLKVPGKGVRTEIREPLGTDSGIPPTLAELIHAIAHGEPLDQVAVIRTERHVHRLAAGADVVEVADDHVRTTSSGDVPHVREWREVEAELVAGPVHLLRRVEKRLTAAGATPSTSASKLARALIQEPTPIDDASDLIRAYLDDQVAVLAAGDVALRRGLDPIHRTRVAVRSFRSVLRVLAAGIDGPAAAHLDAELSWYQDLLGEVRDRQVQRARFASALRKLPPELVLGPVASDVEQTLLVEQLAARDRLTTALDAERYRRLLAATTAFVREPPLVGGLSVADVRRLARKARHKARRRLTAAVRSADPVDLHRARKALKRSRYATELVEPVEGTSAKKLVRAHKRAQKVLGEHQDSIVAGDLLRRLGAALGSEAGRNGFTYGVLWEREQELGRHLRSEAAKLNLRTKKA